MPETRVMGRPCADLHVVERFAAALRDAGFTTEGIEAHLGADVSAALTGGVSWPAAAILADDRPLSTLIAVFLLGEERCATAVAGALRGVGVDELADQGILAVDDDGQTVRPILDVRPYADDAGEYYVFADQDSGRRSGMLAHDHVLGIGGASISLARAVIRRPVGRALDIGTGCGVQALHLGAHCADIVATVNASLNRKGVTMRPTMPTGAPASFSAMSSTPASMSDTSAPAVSRLYGAMRA